MKTAIFTLLTICLAAAPACADATPAGEMAQVQNGVRIVVPARNIARGEVISDSDLAYGTIPAGRVYDGVATSMRDLDGKQARRMLRVGAPVRSDDVRAPILVNKGATVTMTFNAPGISLTAIGKAMSEGGMGETVTVLNPVSYRQITATVTGPGEVAASGTTSTISAASTPARLAAMQP